MYYSGIKTCDIANGVGVRNSIWVSGCPHHCHNCFNKETWEYDYGDKYTTEIEDDFIASAYKDYIAGITILGGEPLCDNNKDTILGLVKKFKAIYKDSKTIWIYSGYTIEELVKDETNREILGIIDTLVDGRYIEELRDTSLRYRGSSNQRIIDTKRYLSMAK